MAAFPGEMQNKYRIDEKQNRISLAGEKKSLTEPACAVLSRQAFSFDFILILGFCPLRLINYCFSFLY